MLDHASAPPFYTRLRLGRLWRIFAFEPAKRHKPDQRQDPFTPHAAAAARRPGWLARLAKHIFNFSFSTAFALFIALAIYTAWQIRLQRSAIIINPITVPAALATDGYTSALATQNLRDEIQYLQNAANTKFNKTPYPADNQTNWNQDVNAIDLPGTGLSIRDIVDLLRTLIPGLQPREITGEFFLSNNRLVLELWLGDNNIYYGMAAATGIDQAIVTSLIDGIDRHEITQDTPESALGAAFAIIRKTQPYIAASVLDSWNAEPNATAILNDIIDNASNDDPQLPWVYNLLGFIDLKARNDAGAIAYFLKAPSLALAHANLCFIYFDQTQPSYDLAQAQTECARAIAMDPTLLKAHELLGEIYVQRARGAQDTGSAQKNFKNAIAQFKTVETLIASASDSRLSTKSDLTSARNGLKSVCDNPNFHVNDAACSESD